MGEKEGNEINRQQEKEARYIIVKDKSIHIYCSTCICMYMYICLYIYMYMYVHVYMLVHCTCKLQLTFRDGYMYRHMYTCTRVCTCVHVYMCMYYTCVHARVHVYIHVHCMYMYIRQSSGEVRRRAHMIQEVVSLDAGDSVDVVAIVNGCVAELGLCVS